MTSTILIKNLAGVAVHDIPAGEPVAVKAAPDGKTPFLLLHRKRIADGTFQIVKADKPAKAPAKKAEG